jgi:hypothetical protein
MNGRASADDEANEAFCKSEDQAQDEDNDDDVEWVHQLVKKMETLTTTIQSSTGLQEKILQLAETGNGNYNYQSFHGFAAIHGQEEKDAPLS